MYRQVVPVVIVDRNSSPISRLVVAAIAHARQIPLHVDVSHDHLGAPAPDAESHEVADLATRVWHDLTELSRALGIVDSGDDRRSGWRTSGTPWRRAPGGSATSSGA